MPVARCLPLGVPDTLRQSHLRPGVSIPDVDPSVRGGVHPVKLRRSRSRDPAYLVHEHYGGVGGVGSWGEGRLRGLCRDQGSRSGGATVTPPGVTLVEAHLSTRRNGNDFCYGRAGPGRENWNAADQRRSNTATVCPPVPRETFGSRPPTRATLRIVHRTLT